MKRIEVFGPGCSRCRSTAQQIEQVARELAVAIELTKVEDYAAIAAAGVMATPAVAVDGQLVHAGTIPNAAQVRRWLS